jgi:trehalose synthase
MAPLVGCARGVGVDTRWLVIAGTPEFFRITKRLHNLLHEDPGDGGDLGDAERRVYEEVLAANGVELKALLRPDDLVWDRLRHGTRRSWSRCRAGTG